MINLPVLNDETHEMYSALINYEDTYLDIEQVKSVAKKYKLGIMWLTQEVKSIIDNYDVIERCDDWVKMRLVRPKFIAMYLMSEE